LIIIHFIKALQFEGGSGFFTVLKLLPPSAPGRFMPGFGILARPQKNASQAEHH